MKYSSKRVRNDFIDFFSKKNHTLVRSAPVIPIGDPTLLFTNAGMNQFKDIFLDKKKSDYKRAVNSQKCIRVSGKHNDLEEVGVDNYHHTFFEMLGNWSFGDYYKEDAIIWSWELLTKVWNLDTNRIWITVYKEDDETEKLWLKHSTIDPSRILKFGNKNNFWEMGDVGPCGPCSEIHYYTGDDVDNQQPEGVNNLEEYREFWNLVFIEYNRDSDGTLHPLKNKHVDTGMGLERMVAILNDIESNYDTDLFQPIIQKIRKISGIDYNYENGVPHRVIADHIRMLSCSIADGVMPSNEGRGYVVRRVLRRASRYGKVLNMQDAFLYNLVDDLVDILGDVYPELNDKKEHIKKVIQAEEIAFGKTLDRGLTLINKIFSNLGDNKILSGQDVFKLYDTYGFPLDLTKLIAFEKGIDVDENEFNKYMNIQKEHAKKNQKFRASQSNDNWVDLNEGKTCTFVGYEQDSIKSLINKYRIVEDNKIEVISASTPFYAEAGGQIGDTGFIYSDNYKLEVIDTYNIGDDICHLCTPLAKYKTLLNNNDECTFAIDFERRKKIRVNHTATHLLHKGLKEVLGNHIQQAGSLVSDDRLRFDLTHYEKLTDTQIEEVELIINKIIQDNLMLKITNENFNDAKDRGVEALFGEKYSDIVRVIDIDGFSMELCGGTHVNRTGDIGLFKIISESSLAAGVRRIEAITGTTAIEFLNNDRKLLNSIKNKLQCNDEDIITKIDSFIEKTKENNKLIKQIQSEKIKKILLEKEVIENGSCPGLNTVFKVIDFSIDSKLLVDIFLDNYKTKSICLIAIKSDKPMLLFSLTKDLQKSIHAGKFVSKISQLKNSRGGGPAHFGTAGFKDNDTLDFAFKESISAIKSHWCF